MNSWKIISDQEIEAIHEATLRVLSEVGIVLDHPQIREQLADAGASFNGDRVQLPPDLVEKSIQICPKQIRIRGVTSSPWATVLSIGIIWEAPGISIILEAENFAGQHCRIYVTPPGYWMPLIKPQPSHPFLHQRTCQVN